VKKKELNPPPQVEKARIVNFLSMSFSIKSYFSSFRSRILVTILKI